VTVIRSLVVGSGSYLPERCVTNAELAEKIDTSDDWIASRTGIRQRHIAADSQPTSDLATRAAQRAMDHAGVSADDIDLIVLATATPDLTFPATAAQVQANLGISKGCAFDVQAVCTGFVYALAVADNFVRLGQSQGALVIGAETFSRILDWEDRNTCVLFGDGAGAVVLRPGEGEGTSQDRGILSTHLHADGRHTKMLYVDGGPSTNQVAGLLRMEGREVFKHAVVNLAQAVDEALAANNLVDEDVDWLVPHQANRRIIDATARKLGLSEDKVVITIDRHANTSAASIPLALADATSDGRIKRGDLILLEAMGGGFTWGSAMVRW
jgi:3-oxoacyl-[acyl-carrier-protein] synthase-3